MRLRSKLLAVLLPLAAFGGGVIVVLARRSVHAIVVGGVEKRAAAAAVTLAHGTAAEFEAKSESGLLETLQAGLRAGAAYAYSLDTSGVVLAHTDVLEKGKRYDDADTARALAAGEPVLASRTWGGEPAVSACVPVWRGGVSAGDEFALVGGGGGTRLGTLCVGYRLAEPLATERDLARRLLAILLAAGGALAAAALLAVRAVLLPVERLAEAVERLGRGELSGEVPVLSDDELGELTRRFNEMRAALARTTVSKEELDAVLGSMGDALFVTDAGGVVRRTNPAAAALLGWGEAELAGRPFESLLAAPPGTAPRGELLFRAKDGSEVPVLMHGAPLPARAGAAPGTVYVAADIRERKRQEEALRRESEALARSNAELEQFAYVASHDLQEPLRKVASFAELLRTRTEGGLDAEGERYIGFIIDGARRMRTLINDLLLYSRVTREEGGPIEVDLGGLVDDVLADLAVSIRESGARVAHGPLPSLLLRVGPISQVFRNLIANAIKFRGGTPPRVYVSAERRGAEWVFCVQDEGIGIAAADIPRLFIMFKRLHSRAQYPGTGMGLALCKKVVESYRGRIWVESEEGRGARFYFTLPAGEGAGG